MRYTSFGLCLTMLLLPAVVGAAVFGNVRGIIHDPTDSSIPGAQVTIHSRTSDWSQNTVSDTDGAFIFSAVPVGDYTVTVMASGFASMEQQVTVISDSAPLLRFILKIAGVEQDVEVVASPVFTAQSSTPVSIVNREEIARTPGADRTNSVSMITDYVPGTYLTHDQLHIRGGHAVTWAIDGVPIPNTNIASNVGPHLDPKNIDYLEVLRGSYAADWGDRTYGIFNVVPRTGFERNQEAQLVASFGNFNQTNDELSFGSHTTRFAYLASVNGNRSDLGLETPTSTVIHDGENGFGGFGSLIFNVRPIDQLRLVTSLRRDFYRVPNDPDAQAAGVRDVERESDAFIDFSWVHTIRSGVLLTLSPFYHFNRAHFVGGPADPSFNVQQNHSSNYGGGQAILSAVGHKQNTHAGFYGFAQNDNSQLSVQSTGDTGSGVSQKDSPSGNLAAVFLDDEYQATSWLRLNGGVRFTRFSGSVSENAASPRAGGSIRIPKLNWTVRGFYGRFYQAPPLSTASGPLLRFVLDQGFGFIPLYGERDEEHQFGLMIPIRGWTLDVDNFRTQARNFFDHNPVGNSNIFFPLTIDHVRVRGTEATIRSPRLLRRGQIHVVYSHQYAEGFGAITGGLTDFSPPAEGFFLDHDQRHTLSGGFDLDLPRRAWVNGNIYYGSGFLNEDGPAHLPGHTTVDVAVGKTLGERLSLTVTALNIANRRFLLDNSTTFAGGSHFFHPREIFAQIRYRFHY